MDFKTKIYEEFVKNLEDENYKVSDISQIRLRNPKNDDLGDIITSKEEQEEALDAYFLYDDKEFLVQKIDENLNISQIKDDTESSYTILVREWHPDTWAFGTLYEVKI